MTKIMKTNILKNKGKDIYSNILNNKLITICILFTVFTMLDVVPILSGLWPPKTGLGPYVHLLGRLILFSILIYGLFFFELLRKNIKSTLLVYIITFVITWGLLVAYLWITDLFTQLHHDAYKDMTRSYGFMYLLLGIIVWISNRARKRVKQNSNEMQPQQEPRLTRQNQR